MKKSPCKSCKYLSDSGKMCTLFYFSGVHIGPISTGDTGEIYPEECPALAKCRQSIEHHLRGIDRIVGMVRVDLAQMTELSRELIKNEAGI